MILPDLIVRTKRRTLSLTINKKGELIVRAPKRLPIYEIMKFIDEKEKWIEGKQKNIFSSRLENEEVENYNKIFFLGKKYNIIRLSGTKQIELTDDALICPTNLDENGFKKIIIKWVQKNACEIIKNRIEYFARLTQIDYKKLILNNSKTRWGSCDSNGLIKINFRVVMLPHDIIDYIIVHELCHVLQMNHSAEFYKLIECVLPSYKILKKKLKNYDYLLELYRL